MRGQPMTRGTSVSPSLIYSKQNKYSSFASLGVGLFRNALGIAEVIFDDVGPLLRDSRCC